MNIVFMGTPDLAAKGLSSIISEGFSVSAVVTNPDRPKGRSGKQIASPVKLVAIQHGIEVLQPVKASEPEFIARLRGLAPDVIVVIAYGHILKKSVLEIPSFGCINVHTSLLPKYRGAAPVQQAILDGCTETGVTTMLMDEGMDTGDILLQRRVSIESRETAGTLFDKLANTGAELIVETLNALKDEKLIPKKQEGDPSYVRQLKKEDGDIDWTKSASEIERRIRGLYPWPGAYSFLDGMRVRLIEAEPLNHKSEGEPGSLFKDSAKELIVNTGDGLLKLISIQPEGKKIMSAEAFLRGTKLKRESLFRRGG